MFNGQEYNFLHGTKLTLTEAQNERWMVGVGERVVADTSLTVLFSGIQTNWWSQEQKQEEEDYRVDSNNNG